MLVAQTLTIAALGKATWQAFFRRRDPDAEFERDEKLHPTMIASLGLLAAGCVAFGAFPTALIGDFAAPAAGALLHPAAYAHGVLASGGPLSSVAVSFDYVSPIGLLTVLGTLIVALPVAVLGLRWSGSRPVVVIRRVQSGSVNDYASYLVAGLIVVVFVLTRAVLT
jgi:multicomponent Na+:H+ antiporter subunit D